MMLQEEGCLLISDLVGKYLLEYMEIIVVVVKEEGGYEVVKVECLIIICDLLIYMVGIGYGYGFVKEIWEVVGIQGWYFVDWEEFVWEMIWWMVVLFFDVQFGECFVYGYNMDIFGVLIEVVFGQFLDVFFIICIFEFLGMEDIYFYLFEEKVSCLVMVYFKEVDNLECVFIFGYMCG